MRRSLLTVFLAGMVLFLTSCFKEDEMIPPHPAGSVSTDTIAMTQTYRYQVYFDLKGQTATGTNVKSESDLAFDCSPAGWRILLNTADFMYAADLGVVAFGTPKDTTGVHWRFDKSNGDPDSLAIGQWFQVIGGDTVSNDHVYLINAGLDDLGNSLGFYQATFDSLKNGTFYFRYASLDGTYSHADSAKKDTSVNFMYYSFVFESEKPFEPAKDNWDLLFTQYTTLLYTDLGEPYPYLVTGVLVNRNGVEVAMDSTSSFESIDAAKANLMTYSNALDAIGYEWKYYDFELGTYTVDYKKNYLIRTTVGYLFKLRFVGFYNSAGEKGYPVIEYQEL
jgi:hypothetical protein